MMPPLEPSMWRTRKCYTWYIYGHVVNTRAIMTKLMIVFMNIDSTLDVDKWTWRWISDLDDNFAKLAMAYIHGSPWVIDHFDHQSLSSFINHPWSSSFIAHLWSSIKVDPLSMILNRHCSSDLFGHFSLTSFICHHQSSLLAIIIFGHKWQPVGHKSFYCSSASKQMGKEDVNAHTFIIYGTH